MHKGYLIIAACGGALSVILGAFGAHALRKLVPEDALQIFETAVRYQFYHVFAIAITAILFGQYPNTFISWAGICFIAGIVLFSGSLYLLTYAKAVDSSSFSWVGPVTPLGGLLLIAGWILMVLGILK